MPLWSEQHKESPALYVKIGDKSGQASTLTRGEIPPDRIGSILLADISGLTPFALA